jgi:hypothetical protein
MWNFFHLRDIAIREITYMNSLDDLQLVVLATSYGVKRWFLDGLNRLAQRERPIQLADSEWIGVSHALKLAEVREGYRNFPNLRGSHDFRPAICVVFESELVAIDEEEAQRAICHYSQPPLNSPNPGNPDRRRYVILVCISTSPEMVMQNRFTFNFSDPMTTAK